MIACHSVAIAMREVQNKLRKNVNQLQEQNNKLSAENTELEGEVAKYVSFKYNVLRMYVLYSHLLTQFFPGSKRSKLVSNSSLSNREPM